MNTNPLRLDENCYNCDRRHCKTLMKTSDSSKQSRKVNCTIAFNYRKGTVACKFVNFQMISDDCSMCAYEAYL